MKPFCCFLLAEIRLSRDTVFRDLGRTGILPAANVDPTFLYILYSQVQYLYSFIYSVV